MKKLILSFALLFAGGFVPDAFAQLGPEWGATDAERSRMQRNYSFLNETIKTRQYGKAAYYLQELMSKAPGAHINIYILGGNMYKTRAEAAGDEAERMVYADSLMMMYDRGVEYFGDTDPLRRRQFIESKAIDYMNFNPLDRKGIATHFRTAIEELGNDVGPGVILAYFNELSTDYRNNDISMENFLLEFDRLYPLVVARGSEAQVKQLEGILAASGAANCEGIEKIYGKQVAERPDDLKLLETVVALLNRADCKDSEFYLKTVVHYYKLNPSGKTAMIIGDIYRERGDMGTAMRYFNDALGGATNSAEKARLSTSIAALQLDEQNYREAYNFASRAAQFDSKNATAFFIMGMAQANGAGAVQDEFRRQTVYWLVVDNLQQARTLAIADPKAGLSVNDVNKNIAQFQTGFPSVEDLFFHGLDEGASYTVDAGWITGKTTVRKRP